MLGGSQGTAWQVHRVRSLVVRFDLCALPYFLHPFPGPYRAGVPSWLAPVDTDCASLEKSGEQGFGASPVRVESGVRPGLPDEEAV